MRKVFVLAATLVALLSSACSDAKSEKDGSKGGKKKDKDKKESLENRLIDAAVPGLRRTGALSKEVPESSGLARADQPGTFYTQADAGNSSVLYKIDTQGKLLSQIELPVPNEDWESLAEDNQGTLFVADCGNNNNDRRNLVIYRLDPENSQQVGEIQFSYADQQEFPPSKKQRNFDCEASLWHAGKVYLFTKDRAQQSTSKVYAVPDKPGQHTATLVTKLAIPGEVTGADLSPDGRRLVLLAREELFVLEGSSFENALKAKPRRVALEGAGQTEGVVFIDDETLMISTEQGALYEYKL